MPQNLETRLVRCVLKANNDYNLIHPGDRILLAFSGGKDSFGLFQLLHIAFVESGTFDPPPLFKPVCIDLGWDSSKRNGALLRAAEYISCYGYTLFIDTTDISKRAHLQDNNKKGQRKNPCFLCARMRRRRLYEIAAEYGCSKIALGHHKDDIIETLLLNIFFSREISTMIPLQKTFSNRFQIIRPLAYIEERYLQKYALKKSFPVIKDPCIEKEKSKRWFIKNLIKDLEQEESKIKHNIFLSLKNVKIEFLL